MHLDDISRWARGNGLEILLFAIGSVLVARFVHWVSGLYQARVYQTIRAQMDQGGVLPEHTKRARAMAQAAELAVTSVVYFVAALLILAKFGLPLSSLVPPRDDHRRRVSARSRSSPTSSRGSSSFRSASSVWATWCSSRSRGRRRACAARSKR